MRRLIESLTPGDRPISWNWIGGMFAFYLVAMTAAVTLFAGHQTKANLAHEAGATVAAGSKSPSIREPGNTRGMHHLAQYREDAIVQGSE
jgi:D-arabinose 1-dehydrogenase-like Zn-dependent alcohol dehydrogenase